MLNFLYTFNFAGRNFVPALQRLKASMRSIAGQEVQICVSNNSPTCILRELEQIVPNVRYLHKPYLGAYSKAAAINFGVKNLVDSEYFVLSDIDLVYRKTHISDLMKKLQKNSGAMPIRLITYNYNLLAPPRLSIIETRIGRKLKLDRIRALRKIPKYTPDYEYLWTLPKSSGGFAHGNGLVHRESFMQIHGFDEEMVGYGPEDDLFNMRIGQINKLIYDASDETATIHLWHPPFHHHADQRNRQIWESRKEQYLGKIPDHLKDRPAGILLAEFGLEYFGIKDRTPEDVRANKSKPNWGTLS
jgi:hypothetical protein